jgi:hypothetical protein
MEGIVVRRLREARRWLVLQQSLEYAVWSLFAGLTVLGIGGLVASRTLKTEVSWLAAIGCPVALAALGGLFRWRSLRRVARELDVRAKTKDRFLTAVALSADEAGPLWDAARREMCAFAAKLCVRNYLRPSAPSKKALWLLLPLTALGLLKSLHISDSTQRAPELASAQALLEQVRRAAELEAKEEESFQQIAEDLQRTQRQLVDSREPLREALRTLADLEQKLSAQSELDVAEISAIAEALAREHAELASKLRAGKNAEAARAVAQMNPAELAKALEQAARHLETARLRELARQTPLSAKFQLALMLGSSGRSGKEASHLRFLAAIRDLKRGSGVLNPEGDGGIAGVDIPPGKEASSVSPLDNAPPAGEPGSEKDSGRGEDLSKEAEPADQAPRDEDFVAGEISEGPSLVELFRAAGNDDPKAQRAYRAAYQTAAPAALDAVSKERIPAGSRLLVRRYFEAIRPKE